MELLWKAASVLFFQKRDKSLWKQILFELPFLIVLMSMIAVPNPALAQIGGQRQPQQPMTTHPRLASDESSITSAVSSRYSPVIKK